MARVSADANIGQAIDLFLEREAAEAMLTDWLADEPDWADALSRERIELEDWSSLN